MTSSQFHIVSLAPINDDSCIHYVNMYVEGSMMVYSVDHLKRVPYLHHIMCHHPLHARSRLSDL